MGIMKTISKLPKAEREKVLKEYNEAKERLKKSQDAPYRRKRTTKKAKPQNGEVVTYHISELEPKTK